MCRSNVDQFQLLIDFNIVYDLHGFSKGAKTALFEKSPLIQSMNENECNYFEEC